MEEVGVVREIRGPMAVVCIERKGGCEQCQMGSVCKTSGADESVVEALNNAGAQVGDTVKIIFKSYTYLKGTVLVYGLPAVMLVIGAVIGKDFLSKALTGMDPDIVSAIGGFGFFLLSFLAVKLFSKRYEGRKEYLPVVDEIIKSI